MLDKVCAAFHRHRTSADLSLTSPFRVQGKLVLVTGGGSGIGKMVSTGFTQNGAKV
ncbi:hypothetical protein EST38_g8124 [Candolleomyces aberdarensis]|uniref:Uncharacterized protein n=1 Tax=Candolleomyces aberdarensis TaxID=2316362 RepID=A0A4V1Q386_9AGAR|nr:hypothetical protein EST38_g8124 [Candolleomyces aberdarensis]